MIRRFFESSSSNKKVIFGKYFVDEMLALQEQLARTKIEIELVFPDDFMREIDLAIQLHKGSTNVLYEDLWIEIPIVGISNYQMQLATIFSMSDNNLENNETVWHSGFLLPEPWNAFDRNAVSLIILETNDEKTYKVFQVGHVEKSSAARIQGDLINFLSTGKVIPAIFRLIGGEGTKSKFGLVGGVKSSAIKM
jgi:hypothetical protein